MGYETDYSGTIKVDKNILKKIEEYFEEIGKDIDEHFDIDGVTIGDDGIEISGYGKMYEEELEKFCLFIAKIDNGAVGEIKCKGEDSDDFWKINISEGKAEIIRGYIAYNEEDIENFESDKINKDVYKITKDEQLLKEIIVEELER